MFCMLGCWFAYPQHGKQNWLWTSYTSSVFLENGMTMRVHQLDQHYSRSSQNKPVWTNMKLMLVYAGFFNRAIYLVYY